MTIFAFILVSLAFWSVVVKLIEMRKELKSAKYCADLWETSYHALEEGEEEIIDSYQQKSLSDQEKIDRLYAELTVANLRLANHDAVCPPILNELRYEAGLIE